jgi:adenylate kinase
VHLIIYGPEGSGKGTQARLLAKKFNLPVFTSGDLVRNAAKNDKSALGGAARKALNEGKYVSDEDMFQLWKNILKTTAAAKGFILDGFPRNINQAEFVDRQVLRNGYSIDRFIYLDLSDREAIKRLSKRHRTLFPGSKINHDNPERVKERLKIYREKERDLLNFFRKKGILVKIDADQEIGKVHKSIVEKIKS